MKKTICLFCSVIMMVVITGCSHDNGVGPMASIKEYSPATQERAVVQTLPIVAKKTNSIASSKVQSNSNHIAEKTSLVTTSALAAVSTGGSVTGITTVGGVTSGLTALGGSLAGGVTVLAAAPAIAVVSLAEDDTTKAGAIVGSAGSVMAVSALGSTAGITSVAGVTSGLTALGGFVGGGMAAGVVGVAFIPLAAAFACWSLF